MLTTADKAWVSGLVAWLGAYLSSRFTWLAPFVTPELIGLIAGALTYWVPNRAPATVEKQP